MHAKGKQKLKEYGKKYCYKKTFVTKNLFLMYIVQKMNKEIAIYVNTMYVNTAIFCFVSLGCLCLLLTNSKFFSDSF